MKRTSTLVLFTVLSSLAFAVPALAKNKGKAHGKHHSAKEEKCKGKHEHDKDCPADTTTTGGDTTTTTTGGATADGGGTTGG